MATSSRPNEANAGVKLQRAVVPPTADLGLWAAIRSHASAISFGRAGRPDGSERSSGYAGFIEAILNGDISGIVRHPAGGGSPAPDLGALAKRTKGVSPDGVAGYELLKQATEIFLAWNAGVAVRKTDALGHAIASDDEELRVPG